MWKMDVPVRPIRADALGQWRGWLSVLCRAGPQPPRSHKHPATQAHHLFSHISASVAPTLGHSAPYISFSTSRMFCRVRNLVGLVS